MTTAFVDREALAKNPDDPEAANVPVGKTMTVTADRGRELIDLGVAQEVDATAAPSPTA
ncbi:hypothetical protein [Sphingomonas hankookensis]|uniref:hypothetical protein n=1 Tax=Sphingomonas hankookensis TaxID=563996 RepID=UPI00234E5689|nr:hypothetical protein [Sphingomonas hankookensis]WCP71554.1 hypothetical protein PPZ50_14515 [Sphingomonas hankookensis]